MSNHIWEPIGCHRENSKANYIVLYALNTDPREIWNNGVQVCAHSLVQVCRRTSTLRQKNIKLLSNCPGWAFCPTRTYSISSNAENSAMNFRISGWMWTIFFFVLVFWSPSLGLFWRNIWKDDKKYEHSGHYTLQKCITWTFKYKLLRCSLSSK